MFFNLFKRTAKPHEFALALYTSACELRRVDTQLLETLQEAGIAESAFLEELKMLALSTFEHGIHDFSASHPENLSQAWEYYRRLLRGDDSGVLTPKHNVQTYVLRHANYLSKNPEEMGRKFAENIGTTDPGKLILFSAIGAIYYAEFYKASLEILNGVQIRPTKANF